MKKCNNAFTSEAGDQYTVDQQITIEAWDTLLPGEQEYFVDCEAVETTEEKLQEENA